MPRRPLALVLAAPGSAFDVVAADVAGLDFVLAVETTATSTPTLPSLTLLDPTATALPPTRDNPVQPPAGPGDLADTGGPSGLLALLGLVLAGCGTAVVSVAGSGRATGAAASRTSRSSVRSGVAQSVS